MDPLTLIVGALLALVFFALGRMSGRRQAIASGQAPPPPPKPICGCTHGLHEHDLEGGKCHAEIKKWAGQHRDKRGELWDNYKFVTCGCRRYTGPIPAEEYLAQQLLPPVEGV
jgi:hypothetical protein